jgi:hypothetical protein
MVARGLKHGMMSAIPEPKVKGEMDMPSSMEGSMHMPMNEDAHMFSHMNHYSDTAPLSKSQLTIVLVGSFAVLALSLWITSLYVPITFTFG